MFLLKTNKISHVSHHRNVQFLWVMEGKSKGSVFYLKKYQKIGRETDSCIVLDDARVSRCHVELLRVNNKWYLSDLCSTNGTWINNRKVMAGRIKNGDLLQMGETKLLFISVRA